MRLREAFKKANMWVIFEHPESTYTYHVGQAHEGTGRHVRFNACSTEDRCWEEDNSIDTRKLLNQEETCPHTNDCKRENNKTPKKGLVTLHNEKTPNAN